MNVSEQEPTTPRTAELVKARPLHKMLLTFQREMRDRREWYKQHRHEDRVRHWWDVYTR